MNTAVTNETNGAITRITAIHPGYFDYRWLIVAIFASVLLAWALRKIFWRKDSN